MFIHHVATILLIATSYCINFIQAGAAVMLLHDFSDIFLEVDQKQLLPLLRYLAIANLSLSPKQDHLEKISRKGVTFGIAVEMLPLVRVFPVLASLFDVVF